MKSQSKRPSASGEGETGSGTPAYHVSGLLVVARTGRLEACERELEALPGVEVRFLEPGTHRLIVVQETSTLADQERGFERIRRLPSVGYAALVEYRAAEDLGGVPDEERGEP